MKLQFGTTLRQLRQGRDLTQEALAELLNVAPQSVSRWENEVCYPDLELLPVIAAFFDTTVDRLLGVDQVVEQRQVEEYLTRFQSAVSVGDISACIEIARQGVAEFPGNFALLNKLMYALFVSGDETGNIPDWAENQVRYDGEITALGERIMQFCPDQDIRLEATARLGFHHCDMGRKAQGRAVLEALPTARFCRENWIWWGLEEEEKLPHTRRQISQGFSTMRAGMYNLTWGRLLPDQQLVQVYEKMYALDALVLSEYAMDAHFYHAQTRCQLAATYARLGQTGQALEQLTIAAEAALAFDQRSQEETTSCLLLGEKVMRRSDFDTADSRPCRRIMAETWLSEPDFDGLRHTDGFKNVENLLK